MLKDVYQKFIDSGAKRNRISVSKEVQNDLLSFIMHFEKADNDEYDIWFVIYKKSSDIKLSAIAKCISFIFKEEYFYLDFYPDNSLTVRLNNFPIKDEDTEEVETITKWVNLFTENEKSLYEFLDILISAYD